MNNITDFDYHPLPYQALKTPSVQNQIYTPPQTAGLYLSSANGKFSGSENLAAVTRAEWEDYKSRFAPVEDMLIDEYNNHAGRELNVNQAGLNAGLAFDKAKSDSDRSLSRYGLNLNPEQQARRNKKYALERTAAMAGAKNTARDEQEDIRMGLVTGSFSNRNQG